jgi:hypothetical protein
MLEECVDVARRYKVPARTIDECAATADAIERPVMTETPKGPATRTQAARLYMRMPADVKATIRRAAYLSGQSLSEFVVSSALAAAEKTIREHGSSSSRSVIASPFSRRFSILGDRTRLY